MKIRMLAAAAMTCGTIGGFAHAQEAEGRVAVDLTAIQSDIATELGIDAATVPTIVNLPIGVAAEACGVEASTLSAGAAASAGATATTGAGTGGDTSTSTGGDGAGSGDTGSAGTGSGGTEQSDGGETGDGDSASVASGADTGGATVMMGAAACSATTSSQAVAQFVQTEINAGSTTP